MKRFWKSGAYLFVVLCCGLVLTGCAGPSPISEPAPSSPTLTPYACLLPSERRMLVAELFFGGIGRDRSAATERRWTAFLADTVIANFPDGFTVFDGDGQWRYPQTGQIGHEPSKILLVAAPRQSDLAGRLTTVIEAYKARFRQHSVGLITRDSCAVF